MDKNKDFDLSPFCNSDDSRKQELKSDISKISLSEKIINIVNSCEAILVHECDDLEKFSGRDVDAFYISEKTLLKFDEKDLILHQREPGSYRILINDKKIINFINVDLDDINIFSKKTKLFNKEKYSSAVKCQKTGLKHLNTSSLIFYKLIKYFSHGLVHSYKQLFMLKNLLNSLNQNELNNILDLSAKYLKNEYIWINMLINDDFKNFENNQNVQNFWIKKRISRQKKRKVYAGKLNIRNLIFSGKFLYALILGSKAKWSKNHKPLPAIAIIGNDGSGKSTIINYILKNYSKIDPAYISMRSDKPMLPLVGNFRKGIKKLLNISSIKKTYLLNKTLALIGQSIDLLDKYIRYRIGMAWSDSGYGITIFERYITDRIRGEFPNKENKFLPLEQFFPLPDGLIYIDVAAEISLTRKFNDNHTLEEMQNKRDNYISFLLELDETKIISGERNLSQNIIDVKNYIFELAIQKKNRLRLDSKIKRCIWKKNRNRILSGNRNKRFQRDSFL